MLSIYKKCFNFHHENIVTFRVYLHFTCSCWPTNEAHTYLILSFARLGTIDCLKTLKNKTHLYTFIWASKISKILFLDCFFHTPSTRVHAPLASGPYQLISGVFDWLGPVKHPYLNMAFKFTELWFIRWFWYWSLKKYLSTTNKYWIQSSS